MIGYWLVCEVVDTLACIAARTCAAFEVGGGMEIMWASVLDT